MRVAGVFPTGADAVQFLLDSSTCTGADLAPGAFCSVKVRFAPVGAAGPRAAQLSVSSDASGSPFAALSGTAGGV